MILFDLFRRHTVLRFFKLWREEGLRSTLVRTRNYVNAQMKGHGRTGMLQSGTGLPGSGADYLMPVWLEMAEKQAFHVSQPPALLTRRRKIAMIGDLNLPQCRKYRVEQLQELWQLAEVEYGYAHYEDVPRAVELLQSATHVMLYRLPNTPTVSMLLYEARRLRLPILYDLDDPLFSVSAYGTYENMKALPEWQKVQFLRQAPLYLDVMNYADLITVSTPRMQAHTRLYTSRPVHVRRNFADRIALETGAQAMAAGRSDVDQSIRIGFASGSQGHEIDFAEIQDDIIAFLGADSTRQLVILGHFDQSLLPEVLRHQIEVHPFTEYQDYLRTLAGVDVAVMPLADDLFNRCKSAVRVLDAASVGVPSIVGQVSDMAEVVVDGRSGRVMAAGSSWAVALEDMVRDPKSLRTMGQNARQELEDRWSARLEAPVIDRDILDWVRE